MTESTTTTNGGTPALDPSILSTLIHQPEVQRVAIGTLDTQIANAEVELTKLKEAREAIAGGVEFTAPPRRGRRPGPARRPTTPAPVRRAGPIVGRPVGSSPRHGDAIQAVLKTARNGMLASEIFEALEKRKQPGERKTWHTYLAKMKKDGVIVGQGARNSTVYKLAS